jgi:ankyrin repeat protein
MRDPRVDPTAFYNEAIRLASENGHLKVVQLLLRDDRVDPSDDNNYAIRWASSNGHLKVVQLLLRDDRVDPSDDNNYAILWASAHGHLEVVRLLLRDDRVDPLVYNNLVILEASMKGHADVVELLIRDDRVDPSDNNNYAIRLASERGHVEVVEVLLRDRRVFLTGLSIRDYTVLQKTMFDRSSESGKVLVVLYMMYHGVFRTINDNRDRIQNTQTFIQKRVRVLALVQKSSTELIPKMLSPIIKNLQMLYFLHDKIVLQWDDISDRINPDGTYNIYLNDLSKRGIKDLLGRMRELCLEDEINVL